MENDTERLRAGGQRAESPWPWGVLPAWVAATAIGGLFAALIQLPVAPLASFAFGQGSSLRLSGGGAVLLALSLLGATLLGACGSLVVGGAQWLVLRPWLRRAEWWIIANVAGGALTGAITWTNIILPYQFYRATRSYSTLGVLTWGLFGVGVLIIAVAQWGALRELGREAIWWIPAFCATALFIALLSTGVSSLVIRMSGSLATSVLGLRFVWINLVSSPVFAALRGAILGVVLVWLLRGRERLRV